MSADLHDLADLRSAFARGAAAVHDETGPAARVEAVAGRARAVRRRRAAGVAVAAALAVGGVALAVPGGERPAPTDVPGVPRTRTAQGWTYELATVERSEPGDRRLRLELDPEDRPRLVSWSAGEDAEVLTHGLTGRLVGGRVVPNDFADHAEVGPGEEFAAVLRDRGREPMTFAVYVAVEAPPAGVSGSGVTFRERIGRDRLVGGAVGAEGETSVSTVVTWPRRARISSVCSAGGGRGWESVFLDGTYALASGCDDGSRATFDPGRTGATFDEGPVEVDGRVLRPGDRVEVEVRRTRSPGGDRPADDPGTVLGVAVYDVAEPGRERIAPGLVVDREQDLQGHRYRLASWRLADPGSPRVRVGTGTITGPVLVAAAYRHDADGADGIGLSALLDGDEAGGHADDTGGGAGTWPVEVLRPGGFDSVTVVQDRPRRGPGDQLALLVYERVD